MLGQVIGKNGLMTTSPLTPYFCASNYIGQKIYRVCVLFFYYYYSFSLLKTSSFEKRRGGGVKYIEKQWLRVSPSSEKRGENKGGKSWN